MADSREEGQLQSDLVKGKEHLSVSTELPKRFLSIQPAELPSPVVALRRIHTITTYEVMETDLEDLDRATASEGQSLAFACLCLGALISTGLSWTGASGLTATALAVYTAASIVLTLASGNFLLSWRRENKKRRALLERVRSQTLVTEEEHIL